MQYENGQLSGAEAGSIRLQDAPMRMALPPQENALAVALGDGGILKFSIARSADGIPALQQMDGIPSSYVRCSMAEVLGEGRLKSGNGRAHTVLTATPLLQLCRAVITW